MCRPLAVTTLLVAASSLHVSALRAAARQADNASCSAVVFERTDASLRVRTMVVQDSESQRMLVLTPDTDTSQPCALRWWLEHNPQGMVKCENGPPAIASDGACLPEHCKSDPHKVELGYVRTMLASAVFMPEQHDLSAICVELGCRSRIVRTRVAGTLLETAPEVRWAARPTPQRVFVIGLGTSTMALWLRASLPRTELHVAELSPSVVAAAPCFGLNTSDPLLHLHTGDGRAILEAGADGAYDAILVDAFDSNASLPDCFQTQEFFALARRKLAPGGALSLNLIAGDEMLHILKSLVSNFESKKVFAGGAPGAEGIQSVITAFAPGRPGTPGAGVAPEQARQWFGAARYRHLHLAKLVNIGALEDSVKCPAAAAAH
mmetsp:Transcript_88626/g.228582  ORF Transcript_88626/g.228582 Transcript_88626/m.228582 type:complete len:378 (-) Transcript_88626:79-1212(-)